MTFCKSFFTTISIFLILFFIAPIANAKQENWPLEKSEVESLLDIIRKEPLTQANFDLFNDSLSFSGDYPRKTGAVALVKQAILKKQLDYWFKGVPIEISEKFIKAAFKIIPLISSGDISGIISIIETFTVQQALAYITDWLLQNEIKIGSGEADYTFPSYQGNTQTINIQYLIVEHPISPIKGEIVAEFYSKKPIEPPLGKGGLGGPSKRADWGDSTCWPWDIWKANERKRDNDGKLEPFIVRVKGVVEKGQWGQFKWDTASKEPAVEVDFNSPVPEIAQDDITWKDEREIKINFIKEKLLDSVGITLDSTQDAIKELGSFTGKAVSKTAKAAASKIKSGLLKVAQASSNLLDKLKSYISKQEPKAQIGLSTPQMPSPDKSAKEQTAEPTDSIPAVPAPVGAGTTRASPTLEQLIEEFDEIAEQAEVILAQAEKLLAEQVETEEPKIVLATEPSSQKIVFIRGGGGGGGRSYSPPEPEPEPEPEPPTNNAPATTTDTGGSGNTATSTDEQTSTSTDQQTPPTSTSTSPDLVDENGTQNGSATTTATTTDQTATTTDQTTTTTTDPFATSTTPTSTSTDPFTTSTATTTDTTQTANPADIVIVEVKIQGANASYDFIKLFNPSTSSDINISGFQLKKKSSTGKEYSIRLLPKNSIIPMQSYFLWANSSYNEFANLSADTTSTQTLAKNNSIAFLDQEKNIIDALAWGTSTLPFVENTPFPQNPEQGQILRRKTDLSNNYLDTNNNTWDFEVFESAKPLLAPIPYLIAAPSATRKAIDLFWPCPSQNTEKYFIKCNDTEITHLAQQPQQVNKMQTLIVERLDPNKAYTFSIEYTDTNNSSSDIAFSSSTTPLPGFKDNNDGTITDLLTNLIWVKHGNGIDANNDNPQTWQQAKDLTSRLVLCQDNTFFSTTSPATSTCTNHQGIKYDDWRLPGIKELATIVDFSKTGPNIDENYFPNTSSSPYWTSSYQHSSAIGCAGGVCSYPAKTKVQIVDFDSGALSSIDVNANQDTLYYIRPVHGPATSSQSILSATTFYLEGEPPMSCELGCTAHNNNTVIDNCTEQMWINNGSKTLLGNVDLLVGGSIAGKITWEKAIKLCNELVLCQDGTLQRQAEQVCDAHNGIKYDDWRLPNIFEDILAVNKNCNSIFPWASGYNYFYWSATLSGDKPWGVEKHTTIRTHAFNKTNELYLQCIRGGE